MDNALDTLTGSDADPTAELLETRAGEVAQVLRLLANEQRLLVLCKLAVAGEMSVSALQDELRLSQSALSQHLAKMRTDGLVTSRAQGQTRLYRIADGQVAQLLGALKAIYCPELDG